MDMCVWPSKSRNVLTECRPRPLASSLIESEPISSARSAGTTMMTAKSAEKFQRPLGASDERLSVLIGR